MMEVHDIKVQGPYRKIRYLKLYSLLENIGRIASTGDSIYSDVLI